MLRASKRKRVVPKGRGDSVAPAAKRSVSRRKVGDVHEIRSTGSPVATNTLDTEVMTMAPVPTTATEPITVSTTATEPITHSGNCPVFQNPIPCITASDDLARNVTVSLRQKIIAGEYIDLALLLVNSQASAGDKQKVVISQGEILLQPRQQQQKIDSIATWTDAYLVYIRIYCTAHPHVFQELLKYMHSIRLGAKRCARGWKSYDEQFRLRMSQDPAGSWAVVDPELWLLYMYPPSSNSNAPVSTGRFKCYAFNYQGNCVNQSCPYNHSCLRCSDQHPLIQCPRQNVFPNRVGGNARFQQPRPQFRPRFQARGGNPVQYPNNTKSYSGHYMK
ncbi:uncharacterized protein [Mytilus edulis]|uniref:uncharacterized protein n=1 Tax=Mytilus edulis TaxID=6550 RepID=UPI0039F10A4A